MKRRFFSILFVLVLLLTLGLVTSVPAAAQATTAQLSTGTTGIAEWTTDYASTGDHSVYLHATEPNADSYGQVQLEVAPIAMAEFTGVSFFVWELATTIHGGEFPGAWNIPYPYGDPYIAIMLDTDNDGVGDDYLVGTASYTKDNVPAPEGVTHTGPTPETWVEMAEGYGYRDSNGSLNDLDTVVTEHVWYAGMVFIAERDPPGDVWRINDVGTIAEWQGWFAANAPDVTVVGVRIQFGAWLDDPGEGVYVDDVTISGTLYDLEPATGTVTMTAASLIPPPEIGISVDPPSVNFGDVTPGEAASGDFPVTVTNTGNVAEDFTASIINESPEGVYTGSPGLEIDEVSAGVWTAGPIASLGTHEANLVLTVPTGTDPGTYTATLVFWAEASP